MLDEISHYILSILVFFPLVVAAALALIPCCSNCSQSILRKVALAGVFLEFVFSLHLIRYFRPDSSDFQFSQYHSWLPSKLGINYILGVDGLSLSLIIMATFFSLIGMMTVYKYVNSHVRSFLILFLILESTLIGVFSSLDIVLFYVFWELSLIPLYFMIGVWGGARRISATFNFFLYGFFGSVLMLVAFGYLYFNHYLATGVYSSSIMELYSTASSLAPSTQMWLFSAITLAFLVKTPVFPFYSWLPQTYEQAPVVYTIMSGVNLKLATYGLIRFSLCLFPAIAKEKSELLMTLSVIGILFGALIAWRQSNTRRLMAFSSLSHMGFIALGIFSCQKLAMEGALYQMLNHTLTAGGLFILLNFLFSKPDSQFSLEEYGGLSKVLPWFSFFFMISMLGSVALPSTGSFVGEWLILLGSFQAYPLLTAFATLGVILGSVYMLWMTYKLLFGPQKVSVHIPKLSGLEATQMTIISLLIVLLGFVSVPILDHTQATFSLIEKTLAAGSPYPATLVNLENRILRPIVIQQNHTFEVK